MLLNGKTLHYVKYVLDLLYLLSRQPVTVTSRKGA